MKHQHRAAGNADARPSGGVLRALPAFLAGKLSWTRRRRPPRASDLLWSALGMGAAMAAIALIAARAVGLPLVGQLHQQVGRVWAPQRRRAREGRVLLRKPACALEPCTRTH